MSSKMSEMLELDTSHKDKSNQEGQKTLTPFPVMK